MATILTIAQVPDDLAEAWLQHLRDFDTTHDGCHFQALANVPDATTGEMYKTLEGLGLDIKAVFKRKG